MTLMEKCIGNKENPLTIDELKEDLNLRYERLSSKSESTRNDDYGEEKALFVTQFKGKCQNCGKLGHKSAQCKSKAVQEDKEIICNYCKK
jgi:Zinc knuckle